MNSCHNMPEYSRTNRTPYADAKSATTNGHCSNTSEYGTVTAGRTAAAMPSS